MTDHSRLLQSAVLVAAGLAPLGAAATNGMNMEGYGPVSTGMGGASQALDHGTAAMAQNPATLALMSGAARLDVALGRLGPSVTSRMPGMPAADSQGTAYVMPALGYVRRSGSVVWGLGVFARGGMGTDYAADTFMAAGSGAPVRSELGVGRVLLPLTFQASPELAVGATLDYMWASLDLRMAASGAQLGQMTTAASGNLGAALPMLAGAPWARIDFSNSSDFSGAARATGWTGKLGVVYKPSGQFSIGASYQFKSSLRDMKTKERGATMSGPGGFADTGRMTVVDFQWPAMAAIGVAMAATPDLTVAADLKRVDWSEVMDAFRMRYDSAGMGGSVSFAMPQRWKDQTVVNLGVDWRLNDQLHLRFGANLSDNPIPDAMVNPLFPAIVKRHYTAGLGWRASPAGNLDLSLTVAPTTSVTNGQGVAVSHRQTSVQLMYSHRF